MTTRDTASRVLLGVGFILFMLFLLKQVSRVDMGIDNFQATLPPTTNPFTAQ